MGDHLPRCPHPARLHHLIPPQPKHSPLINHLTTQNLSRPLARLSLISPFWSAAAQLPLLHTNPHHKSYPRAPDCIIPELSLNRISSAGARQTFCQAPFPSQIPPPTAS